MSQDYPKCTTKSELFSHSGDQHQLLSQEINRILQGENASVLSKPVLQADQPWLLWVEPIPRTDKNHCPGLYSGTGFGAESCQDLQKILDENWQFSEFFWFVPGVTLHAVQTEQGMLLKRTDAQAPAVETLQRTPYLRQDTKRFQKATWLDEIATSSPLIKDKQLSLAQYRCEKTKQVEYILQEGV
ncbi:hypothetical protein [Oceanospirillum beijerinckii]|uniref:hypothetical protein n=1 Tax=Oceanospirillum beijerinckii TaxID=64976 RepID=UPI00040C61FE|nr:hypothetical protein [Oceanospirillum beijerinckii]